MDIQIKRIYEQRSKNDGTRILVDGLWPRGLTKDDASIDIWLKKIAPSTLLRSGSKRTIKVPPRSSGGDNHDGSDRAKTAQLVHPSR